ncbi:glycosyltransferase family protein [Aureibaculum conchae]|uniref:hypothetical protein n=1 Tax=Aureibaculum sp. 2308TA14-22 TaxID=3108392 RepID=UPI00339AEDB8
MKTVSFFICSNGFGHFKRCARIASHLVSQNDKVKINFICPSKPLIILAKWNVVTFILNHPRICIIEGARNIELLKDGKFYIEKNYFKNINNEITNLSNVIISDNLSSILEIKNNAILMGSFLWSEILKHQFPKDRNIEKFHDSELEVLKRYNPVMIGLNDMAMPYVKKYTDFIGTSWIVDKKLMTPKRASVKNILIMGGGTGIIDDTLLKMINKLRKSTNYSIFVSNQLYRNLDAKNDNCILFDFDEHSFLTIDLMICRPGIGSLTDAITYGIPVFGIGEPSNFEMEFNLKKIEELNFGMDISNFNNGIDELIESIILNGTYASFCKSLGQTNKNGIQEIIDFLTLKYNL